MHLQHGIIADTFSPFQPAHERRIEQALQWCDKLDIIVLSSPEDAIPGWQRYHWVRQTYPQLDVRHYALPLAEVLRRSKLRAGSGNLCYLGLHAAEQEWANASGVDFQLLPSEAIAENEVLAHPGRFLDVLRPEVRAWFIKRVALVGPESSGKSYLAEDLARRFDTVFVEEYGRTYCEKFGMDSVPLDFAHVAGGQLFREDEMAPLANRVLFCDTDLLVTQIWSEVYFEGQCQPWIYWANHHRRYDLFLLMAPDIPWQDDGLRAYPKHREFIYRRLQEELESRGLPYRIISGDFEERTQKAVAAVRELLG